jgi:hypothetical protein
MYPFASALTIGASKEGRYVSYMSCCEMLKLVLPRPDSTEYAKKCFRAALILV